MATVDNRTAEKGSLLQTARRRGRFSLSLRGEEAMWFYIFLAPWMLAFLVFTLLPTVATLLLGFTRYNAIKPPEFIGLRNYILLYNDPVFWKSMRVTLVFTAIFVPLQLTSSLVLAVLLNLPRAGNAQHSHGLLSAVNFAGCGNRFGLGLAV